VPKSLYLTQLAERLEPRVLKNIGYASTEPGRALLANAARLAQPGGRRAAAPGLGADLALDRPIVTTDTRGGKREFAGWRALDAVDRTCRATDDVKLPFPPRK
jgi:hypothetical protein